MTNRIQFAWFLGGWNYEKRDVVDLRNRGVSVPPDEYMSEMKGKIFCPACFMPLFRSPSEKSTFSDKSPARYNHYPAFSQIKCRLKTPKAETVTYLSEEIARQAIDAEDLAVVHSFRTDPPEAVDNQGGGQGIGYHEDVDGPMVNYPVGRHKGESFALPTKVSTVNRICWRFDKNLYKYYLFPGRSNPISLASELIDIRVVKEESNIPRLYFGKIVRVDDMGRGNDTNLRMTYFWCNKDAVDFCLKSPIGQQNEKGINADSKGRYILFWGVITKSGVGLSINRPSWGEYAMLPEMYESLLPFAEDSNI
jgi:hypothetical protein